MLATVGAKPLPDSLVQFLRDGILQMQRAFRLQAQDDFAMGLHDGGAVTAAALLRNLIPTLRERCNGDLEGDRRLAELDAALFLAMEYIRSPRTEPPMRWHRFANQLAQAYQFACESAGQKVPGFSDHGPLVKFVARALATIVGTTSPATCEAVAQELKRWRRDRTGELSAYQVLERKRLADALASLQVFDLDELVAAIDANDDGFTEKV